MTTTAAAAAATAVRSPRPGGPRRAGRGVGAAFVKRLPLYLVVAVLLVVFVYPLVWLLLGSLKTQDEFLNNPTWALPENWLNFSNYTTAWGSVAGYLLNSVLAVFPALLITLVIGTAAGFALEIMVFKGRRTMLLLFLVGIMIPGQMILLPLFSVYFNLGLSRSLWPLIITYTATALPLTVFMMATYFRAIPREIFEASTLDGASIIRSFVSVAFPMMRNAVFTIALVQFFFMWNDLLIALTFTTDDSLRTVQVGLLNFTGQFGVVDYGPTFAAICINVLIILVLYVFLNQQVMRGLAAGAVKG
ncbi:MULTISPECIES: carbohydrate ABC transporter permease [unclassified Rathayibacter]|uniref:carbohydrate ABC transporter permease n=1 Tax=unclassified Rathayibacter TaxID=2609250 RepID=UPI000CE89F5D|nr:MULTISPECIES: carbohydrate ABC transporter permease [unclassified Rathayibacter]PPG08130.1 carbohydrate ABC transporter permease [Rathayibacter sp. AY2B1]PPG68295.1 carbohydrate ABC transporter permease [Rathayibacter sp. AY1F4]PPH51678.1 carbohydrate ABC transporter permease [Rathayibacter sp. AY1E2]